MRSAWRSSREASDLHPSPAPGTGPAAVVISSAVSLTTSYVMPRSTSSDTAIPGERTAHSSSFGAQSQSVVPLYTPHHLFKKPALNSSVFHVSQHEFRSRHIMRQSSTHRALRARACEWTYPCELGAVKEGSGGGAEVAHRHVLAVGVKLAVRGGDVACES